MAQLFDAVSKGVGMTTEVIIGDQTYLSTTEHLPEMGTIIVMQDITYVKHLEQERSDFMHALSHDMKTPLTSISGWVQLLAKTQHMDEKGFRYVKRMLEATDRMLDMIGRLLKTVDLHELGHLMQEPCDLVQIVDRIIEDVQGVVLHKSITIEVHQEGEPYQILADSTRIYHMILNLVDNALKYSPEHTRVDIWLEF